MIKTVKNIHDILNLFNPDTPELRVSEVAQKLGMNRSTVRGLMSSLESVNMIKKPSRNGKYRLGHKILALAKVFLSNIQLREIASPYLKELNKITHEEVNIHVIEGDRRLCLDYIESNHPIRHVHTPDRSYGPMHAGAPGKLLLAHLTDKKIDELLARTGLPHYTNNTITNREQLETEIKKIRRNGVAISKGEQIQHLCALSAPIRNYAKEVVAVLSISWLIMNDSPELEEEYTVLVKKEANNISRELGYQD